MPSVSLRQRFIITSIFMIFLATTLVIFIILPTIRDIFSLQKSITSVENFFEQQYDQAKLLRKSLANLPAISKEVNEYRGAIIQRGSELEVITALESIAEANHLQQNLSIDSQDEKNITPNKKSPRDAIKLPSVTFSVTNQGTFIDHLNYLKSIEQLPYYVFIDRIEWQKINTISNLDTQIITVRFKATIYKKK